MAGRIGAVFVGIGRVIRDVGSALSGVRPANRSPDGTFGTQRMYGRQRDVQRRETYPRD